MVVLKSKHRVTLNGKVGTHQRNQCSQVNNCVFFSSTPPPPPYLPPSCSFPRAPSPPSHGCTCPRADRGAGPSRRGATGGRGGDAGRSNLHLCLLKSASSRKAGCKCKQQRWTLWWERQCKGERRSNGEQAGEAKEGVPPSFLANVASLITDQALLLQCETHLPVIRRCRLATKKWTVRRRRLVRNRWIKGQKARDWTILEPPG